MDHHPVSGNAADRRHFLIQGDFRRTSCPQTGTGRDFGQPQD